MSDKLAARGAGGGGALRRLVTSPYLLISLTMLFWASNMVLSRGLRFDIPLVGLSFWRWSMAALLLLPFSLPHLRRERAEIAANWKRLAALGFLIAVGGNTVLYVALTYTTAINAGIVNAAQPGITVALAWLVLRDVVSRTQGVGIAISMAGVLAIVARGDPGVLLGLEPNPGDLLVIVAVVSWALYAVHLKRWPMALHPLSSLQLIMALGAVQILPFYLWESLALRPMTVDPVTIAMVLYLAVFASIVAVLFWNIGVAAIGPGRAAIFVNLIPVYTTLGAVPFLGESLEPFHVAGFALIFAGIYLTTRGR